MRKVKEMQMKLGEVNLADITFDLRSRDEIQSSDGAAVYLVHP